MRRRKIVPKVISSTHPDFLQNPCPRKGDLYTLFLFRVMPFRINPTEAEGFFPLSKQSNTENRPDKRVVETENFPPRFRC